MLSPPLFVCACMYVSRVPEAQEALFKAARHGEASRSRLASLLDQGLSACAVFAVAPRFVCAVLAVMLAYAHACMHASMRVCARRVRFKVSI